MQEETQLKKDVEVEIIHRMDDVDANMVVLMYGDNAYSQPRTTLVTSQEMFSLVEEFQKTGNITLKDVFSNKVDTMKVENIMFSRIFSGYHKTGGAMTVNVDEDDIKTVYLADEWEKRKEELNQEFQKEQ
jgi:hypothetical protein